MTIQLPPREILSNPPPLVYGSICSGIEAATAAWHPLGWKPAFLSEIENFPRAVLQHHYPNVPLHGDFTTIQEHDYAAIDLLVGGTPCQAFSVAGLRKGFADERGNLTLEFVRLAQRLKPQWLVWENVPGVLSIDGGRAFGSFLGGLAECGYGFAYRVLDAQHFGVPQRRRRVFVVGYLGDWRPPAAVLFERESLLRDLTPSREKGESIARGTESGASGGCWWGGGQVSQTLDAVLSKGQTMPEKNRFPAVLQPVTHALRGEGFDASEDGTGRGTPLVPIAFSAKDYGADATEDMTPTLRAGGFDKSHANSGNWMAVAFATHSLRGEGFDASEDGTGRGTPLVPVHPYTLAIRGREDESRFEYRQDGLANAILTPNGGRAGIGVGAVAFAQNTRDEVREMPYVGALAADPGMKQTSYIRQATQVRRLTPRECERLQGFPDDYTNIPWKNGKAGTPDLLGPAKWDCPDGPRYKALGNSMAVPCMRWIGERIERIRQLQQRRAA